MSDKIKLGNVDPFPLSPESKDETIRISLMVEGDLLDSLKARAKEAGLPYQTFMKQILRKFLRQEELHTVEARLARMEAKFEQIENSTIKAATKKLLTTRKPKQKKRA